MSECGNNLSGANEKEQNVLKSFHNKMSLLLRLPRLEKKVVVFFLPAVILIKDLAKKKKNC